jgi:hypothetical protein
MRNFFIAPLIPADYGDPEYFDLWRLNYQQQGLEIAPTGPGAIFIDDDLAAGLSDGGAGQYQQSQG